MQSSLSAIPSCLRQQYKRCRDSVACPPLPPLWVARIHNALSHSNSSFSLRNFVAEEDGFSAGMLKYADKDVFLAAQRQALAAFDDAVLAKTLQASEETAAEEARKRNVAAQVLPSAERIPPPSAPTKAQSNTNTNHGISWTNNQCNRLPVRGV